MISEELLEQYNMLPLDKFKDELGDNVVTEINYYHTFLIKTGQVTDEILESLIENLSAATISEFMEVFINFFVTIKKEYAEVLKYRKIAREEIQRLQGEQQLTD